MLAPRRIGFVFVWVHCTDAPNCQEFGMILKKKVILLAFPALLLGNSANGSISINVTGIRSSEGQLIACLWTEKRRFPRCDKNKNTIRKTFAISGSSMQLRFNDVAPGNYAVTIEHDEDGNGKLKTNFIGMPREGVGVSNNPGGIPRFKNSLVMVAANTTITIRMRYL